jgi:hypothetical protein
MEYEILGLVNKQSVWNGLRDKATQYTDFGHCKSVPEHWWYGYSCARVMVVVLCVSVCVCLLLRYLVSMSQMRSLLCFDCMYCVDLAETLRLRVLASFAGHRCLPRSLMSFRWTKETVTASFQLEGYIIWLEIDPTRRLAHL